MKDIKFKMGVQETMFKDYFVCCHCDCENSLNSYSLSDGEYIYYFGDDFTAMLDVLDELIQGFVFD